VPPQLCAAERLSPGLFSSPSDKLSAQFPCAVLAQWATAMASTAAGPGIPPRTGEGHAPDRRRTPTRSAAASGALFDRGTSRSHRGRGSTGIPAQALPARYEEGRGEAAGRAWSDAPGRKARSLLKGN
jgi:hypothetical protein